MAIDGAAGLVAVPHSLVLRAWEAVSTERSLQRVLEAVADVLLPAVPFHGVALISLASGDDHLLAAHIAGYEHREGETALEYLSRPELRRTVDVVPKPLVPYDDAVVTRAFAGEPYMCPDLLAKDTWYEHEFRMASAGVRAYASVPLLVRQTLLGTAAFSRVDPIPFSATELAILKAVARAL